MRACVLLESLESVAAYALRIRSNRRLDGRKVLGYLKYAGFDNRIWDNLFFWRFYHMQSIFFACIAVVPWWAVACKGWKHSSSLLRCCALSLPGLYLVTFLFGKFDEARQFDAFIPVCMGFIACWLRSELWPAPDASSGFCS